jgi:hypothetical protein
MVVGVLGLDAIMPVEAAEGDVTYVLAWDATGTTAIDGGWTTATDLGYTVTVTDGTLTTYSVTMVACEHDHGWFGWLVGLVGPGIAEAGHSEGDDPALIGGEIVESIVTGEDTVLGTTTVDEPAYCEGHTAWGTIDRETPTLEVTAEWVGPNGSTGTIELASTIDWGVGDDLAAEGDTVHIEVGEPATVVITRSLATMFDGIELTTEDDTDLAMGILRALADSTVFEVVAGTAHA